MASRDIWSRRQALFSSPREPGGAFSLTFRAVFVCRFRTRGLRSAPGMLYFTEAQFSPFVRPVIRRVAGGHTQEMFCSRR